MNKILKHIGYCQRCGLLDHHLKHELCPSCLRITPMHHNDGAQVKGASYVADEISIIRKNGDAHAI